MLCVGSGVENSSVAAIYGVRSWWGRVLVVILLAIGLQFQSRSRCGTRYFKFGDGLHVNMGEDRSQTDNPRGSFSRV